MQATEKQIKYVKFLLAKRGMDTRYINASWKRFGATMRERSGSIDNISYDLASRVINVLKYEDK